MIQDINNSREITFGKGTIAMGPGLIDGKEIAEVIYATDKHPVGEKTDIYTGDTNRAIEAKNVVLRFEGEDAIKSIDILIEDLTRLKANLIELENKGEQNV